MKANKMPSAKNERRDATRGSKATQREGERQKMKFVWVYPALDMPFAARAALRDCSAPLINEPEFYSSSKQQQQKGEAVPLPSCSSPHTDPKYPLNYHCGCISLFALLTFLCLDSDCQIPFPPPSLKYAIQAAHERENCSA